MKLINSFIFKLLASIAFGALGVLAFSPFDTYLSYNGYVIFISFLGFLLLLKSLPYKKAKWIGFTWGIGFFGLGVNWVYVSVAGFGGMPFIANVAIVSLLIAYLSLFPALYSYVLNRFFNRMGWAKWIIFSPVLWFLTEFLRSWILTGFPWLRLGYSQVTTSLLSYAPIVGVEGIDILIVLICGLLVIFFTNLWLFVKQVNINFQNVTIILLNPMFFVVLLTVMLPYFLKDIEWYSSRSESAIKVTLIQPNIEQQLRWNPNELNQILNKTVALTEPHIGKSDVIIWPETAIPSIEKNQVNFLSAFDSRLRANNTQLITGIVDVRNQGNSYNAAIVLGNSEPYGLPNQDMIAVGSDWRYYKHHLVPFGETVPFQSIMKNIAPLFDLPMSSFSQGDYVASNLTAAKSHFLMAICYEIILGQQLRANLTDDTDFIVTISNDAWFGRSIGPWQHLQMAQMRAVELSRPVIRSTNNGITAFIGADGKILSQLPQFKEGSLTENIAPTQGKTFFAIYGHIINWLIVLFMLLLGFFVSRLRKA